VILAIREVTGYQKVTERTSFGTAAWIRSWPSRSAADGVCSASNWTAWSR